MCICTEVYFCKEGLQSTELKLATTDFWAKNQAVIPTLKFSKLCLKIS